MIYVMKTKLAHIVFRTVNPQMPQPPPRARPEAGCNFNDFSGILQGGSGKQHPHGLSPGRRIASVADNRGKSYFVELKIHLR